MRKITLWLLMLFMSWQVGAQVTAYSFVASSGGTIDGMTGSTQLIGSASDDGVSAVTPIGFTFNYAGTDYTQFSVNANGLIRLGATAASSSWSNTTANANTNSPAILPYWDDLATGSAAGGGKVHYLLSGTAPNRKLIIEWFVTVPRATTGAANARIQCELQETTNVIRFIYNGVVANTANSGATIGLATSATVYNTVDATTNINSTSTFTTANTVAIPDGTVYTWTPPSCSAPGGIVASAITANSATISWNAANPVPSNGYEYYIDTVNTAPTGSGTPEATTSVNVSSLAANTTYYVWVRSDCGGNFSAWSPVYSFTTLCATFPAPYAEGFENAGAIPSCWSMSGSENWRFSNTGSGNHIGNNGTITGSTITGGYFAWIDDSSPDTSNATLTSPLIDVSSLTSPTLFFYELSDNEGANPNSTLNVEVWDGAAWNAIATYNTNTNGWTERIIDLSSLTITGDIRVRFIVVESTSFYDDIAIDDVRIDEAPSCFDPINLVASNVTSSSVDFQFDDASGGNQFDFWYVVQPAGTGTSGTLVENYYDPGFGFPMTITCTDVDNDCANTGLQPNTAYEIYVRADCSSNWVGPINFRTLCNAFDTFPFVETFNTDSTSEACWSVINSNGDTDQWNMNGTTIPRSGQAAQLYTDFNSSNNDYLVSPQLDLGTTAKRLKFWVRHYSNSEPDNLNVRISTTGNDIPSFASNLLLSLSTTQITTTYTEYIVDLSAYSGLVYIAFAREDAPADGWYISIDDVTVEDIPATAPSCASNVVGTPDASCGNFANVITWDATSGADGYYLTIGTTSTGTDILNNQDLGNVLTYSFTGTLNTTYFYTLVPYNSNGPATGCTEMSFTTSANGCYCISNPTSVDGQGITNVQIVTTDFANTVNSSPVYNDHTATVVDMAQGINNNVQISFDTGFGYDYNIVIWIDANDDFNLDASEIVYTGLAPNTPIITFDASFVVPNSVPLGQHRMRIVATDALQTPSNPCYSGTYGETADFTINVVAPSCTPPAFASTTVSHDCANGNFNVNVDVTDLGNGSPSISDGTTSWPVSATGVIAVGPFNYGTPVTLTLLHGSDNVCNVTIGTFNYAVCPPANDDCVNAESLTVGAIFADNSVVGTNDGATASTGAPAPGCASYSGGDVWYSAVVPASGSLTFEMNSQSGGITDGAGAVYSGSCGALTLLDCDDFSSSDPNDMPLIEVTGRTPGEVLYFRVWEYGNNSFGEFLVSAYDASLSTNVFENNNFRAYPNPVKDVLTLEYSSDITSVTVFNMLGQQVITRSLNATSTKVDMSQLNAGAYLVSVKMGDVEKTIKVVKQ